MLGRIAAAFGEALATGDGDSVVRLFPTATRIATLAAGDIVALGVTRARARALIGLAAAVDSRRIRLESESEVEATVDELTALPGIGTWTANYIAMRALRWPDSFLANDLVVLKALGETRPSRARLVSESWRPWRSYAVMHLWRNAK